MLIALCVYGSYAVSNFEVVYAVKAPFGEGTWDFDFQGPIEIKESTLDDLASSVVADLKVKYEGIEKVGTVIVQMEVIKNGYGKIAEQHKTLSDMQYNEINPDIKEIIMEQPIIASGDYTINIKLNSPNENIRWTFEEYTEKIEFNLGETIVEPKIKDETDKTKIFVDPTGVIDNNSVVVVSNEENIVESYDWVVFRNNGIAIKIMEAKQFYLVFDSDLNIGYHNFTIELYKKGNIPNEYYSMPLAFAVSDSQNPALNMMKPKISTWDSDIVCQKGIECIPIDSYNYWIIIIGITALIIASIVGFHIRKQVKMYKRFTVIEEGPKPKDIGTVQKYKVDSNSLRSYEWKRGKVI